MKIHEVLDRDPRTARLANNGQARITETADEQEIVELRAELETFVCDGQFGDALQRILDSYLSNLGNPRQDSAWVSGFFGSGKSHLLKMLTHLWVNTRFPGGARARALVRRGLPDEIQAQLRELDIQARRTGKAPVAAAGTLLGRQYRPREEHGALDTVARPRLARTVPAGPVLLLATGTGSPGHRPRRSRSGGQDVAQRVEQPLRQPGDRSAR